MALKRELVKVAKDNCNIVDSVNSQFKYVWYTMRYDVVWAEPEQRTNMDKNILVGKSLLRKNESDTERVAII